MEAILINIFGGIVRCDRVANGVVEAYKNMGDEINVPIIVRLQGTNADIAKQIIDESGLNVRSATLLQEAAEEVAKALQPDDLTKIEGIGPKIQEALNEAGIKSYRKLSVTSAEQLKEILKSFPMAKPSTWSQQADMASKGKWEELREWQDKLIGGVEK